MKKLTDSILPGLLLAVALIASLLPTRAEAQGFSAYAATTIVAGGTNNVAAASTNTYTTGLTLTRQEHLALQVTFRATGTNTTAIQFFVDPSLDGETFDTANDDYSLSFAANGTNLVTVVTNIADVNAIGYCRLRVGNANTGTAITNLTVKYSIKR